MKNKNDLMHTEERYNQKGELSFVFWCNYKDPLTKKFKQKVKTYKVPNHLKGKKEIESYKLKCQLDLKEQTERLSNGILNKPMEDIGFYEFAEKWVEDILIYHEQGYSYYNSCKGYLKIFKNKLGKYTLRGLNQIIIQDFCNWLCERTHKKETITVKQSIRDLVTAKNLTTQSCAKLCELADTTIEVAYKVGNKLKRETAKKICRGLKINFEDYFKAESEQVPYSRGSNNAIKIMLHTILRDAVRQGIISVNYASSDFIRPIKKGSSGKKEILDDTETIKHFVDCINNETDIRKKVAFTLMIALGVRNAELVGLEWKDFDFEKELVTISRNSIYACGIGVVTKNTKTKNSNRTISIPSGVVSLLKDYKKFWDSEKIKYANLWANTDRLFVRWDGSNMAGATTFRWLKQFEQKNGLKEITPHGLRHTNITMQLTRGMDIKTVSARAGHSDTNTTLNIYTHYTKEADKNASNLINQLLYC